MAMTHYTLRALCTTSSWTIIWMRIALRICFNTTNQDYNVIIWLSISTMRLVQSLFLKVIFSRAIDVIRSNSARSIQSISREDSLSLRFIFSRPKRNLTLHHSATSRSLHLVTTPHFCVSSWPHFTLCVRLHLLRSLSVKITPFRACWLFSSWAL